MATAKEHWGSGTFYWPAALKYKSQDCMTIKPATGNPSAATSARLRGCGCKGKAEIVDGALKVTIEAITGGKNKAFIETTHADGSKVELCVEYTVNV